MTYECMKHIVELLAKIQEKNEQIMNWLYANTQPDERIGTEDRGIEFWIEHKVVSKLELKRQILAWHAEMGEYWLDDYVQVLVNHKWADKIIADIKNADELPAV